MTGRVTEKVRPAQLPPGKRTWPGSGKCLDNQESFPCRVRRTKLVGSPSSLCKVSARFPLLPMQSAAGHVVREGGVKQQNKTTTDMKGQ